MSSKNVEPGAEFSWKLPAEWFDSFYIYGYDILFTVDFPRTSNNVEEWHHRLKVFFLLYKPIHK